MADAVPGRTGVRRIRADFRDGDDLAGARYLAYQSLTQENAATESVATRAGFGLDLEFLGGVFENGDADVIVGKRVFDFGGDLGEHLFGIQSSDGVAGDIVDQRELLGFLLLFGEEAGVFDGDGGFAGEDAQQLDVAFIESALLRAVDGHDADGLVVQNQRHGAHRAGLFIGLKTQARGFFGELFADQQRLGGANHVFREVIARGPRSFGLALAFDHFDFEANLFGFAIVEGDEEAIDVEQPLHFGIDATEKRVGFEGGAQGAADFVQDVEFFAAARSLLDEVAIFDGHADLVAEGEEQAQFRGVKLRLSGVPRSNIPKTRSLAWRLMPTTVRRPWARSILRMWRKGSSFSRATQLESRARSRRTTSPPRRATSRTT